MLAIWGLGKSNDEWEVSGREFEVCIFLLFLLWPLIVGVIIIKYITMASNKRFRCENCGNVVDVVKIKCPRCDKLITKDITGKIEY